MPRITKLLVNGTQRPCDADASRSLLSVLRDDLDLTGAKYGCGEAQCGACVVLIEGRATPACVTTVGSVAGKAITTIEGLEQNGTLHPVQQAFLDAGAAQCGYCTPGMILSAVALLNENPAPGDAEIIGHMDSNICRCGTYARILAAIRLAGRNAKTPRTPRPEREE